MSSLGLELILLLVAAALGLLLARRVGELRRLDWWLAALVPPGAGVVLIRLFERIAHGPEHQFNATRVAASIGMARGYNLLVGPEEGPALDFMYGPVSAAAYLPAALSPTPSGAIWAGVAMSLVFALGPFAWLAFAGAERRSRTIASLAVVCLGILCFYDPALSMVASSIHADAPVIGLLGCACACLLTGRGLASDRRMIASALFAVLAVWTKQTAAPIVLALPAYVWLREGWRPALRFALWMGCAGAGVSALFVFWFGIEGILFTMFQIPGGHPWKSADDKTEAAVQSLVRLARTSRLSAALVLVVGAASFRPGSSFRSWLCEQPWTGLAFVGLAMVPISAVGGAKLGGDTNAYAMTTYFLAGAGVLGLAQLAQATGSPTTTAARLALAAIVIFALADEVRSERRRAFEHAVVEMVDWRSNPVERATAFALRHPHQVLFVANPLIGLYSDGRLYHSTTGFGDRRLAGFGVSAKLRRQHLPAKLRYVAVRRRGVLGPNPRPAHDFPTFTEVYRGRELPDHRVWVGRLPEQ